MKDYPASKDREAALFNAARLLEGQQQYPRGRRRLPALRRPLPQVRGRAEEPVPRRAGLREAGRLRRTRSRRSTSSSRRFGAQVQPGRAGGGGPEEASATPTRSRATPRTPGRPGRPPPASSTAAGSSRTPRSRAADAAAESRFQVAEQDLKEFDKLKIGGKGKALENSFTVKRNAVKKVQRLLRRGLQVQAPRVDPGRALPPGLRAGALRRHHQRDAGAARREAARRRGGGRLPGPAPQQTAALEDKAVESYAATLEQARKNRISNEWTKKTLEALNRFRPKEYPVLKDPKPAIAVDVTWPDGLVSNAVAKDKGQTAPAKDVQPAGTPPRSPRAGRSEERRWLVTRLAQRAARRRRARRAAAMRRSPGRRRGRSPPPPRPPRT